MIYIYVYLCFTTEDKIVCVSVLQKLHSLLCYLRKLQEQQMLSQSMCLWEVIHDNLKKVLNIFDSSHVCHVCDLT